MRYLYHIDFVDEELFLLSEITNGYRSGVHTLHEICPDSWTAVRHPTKFGRKFFKWASRGAFEGIHPVGRASNNHQQYMFA